MKVLLVNGSPHSNGNTARALEEIAGTLAAEGIETETLWIGVKPVRGCIACGRCQTETPGRCAFDDDPANRIAGKMADADGLVLGSPVYYGQPTGQLLAVIQRVCFASGKTMAGKPVACVVVCRRGGATAAYQCMNMPFEMLECPVVTSQYWPIVYGRVPGESARDAEGMQTMRTLARRMAWLVQNLNAPGAVPRPDREPRQPTHFIRPDL